MHRVLGHLVEESTTLNNAAIKRACSFIFQYTMCLYIFLIHRVPVAGYFLRVKQITEGRYEEILLPGIIIYRECNLLIRFKYKFSVNRICLRIFQLVDQFHRFK
jgi:hypothetical protein